MTTIVAILRRIGLRRRRRIPLALQRAGILAGVLFDELAEFAPIQPDTPALGTVIDLDALALAHDEIDPAGGASKSMAFALGIRICDVHH
jgi:hypothetical protein